MKPEDESRFFDQINNMLESERVDLDPICDALRVYQKKHCQKGWRILPNRIVALAAVQIMNDWERASMERE